MDDLNNDGAAARMEGMLRGYFLAQALFVAARLGIADLLAEGERSVEDLAGATGVDGDALYRMLRALASEGVFEEKADAAGVRFGLNGMGSLLRADVPGSMRAAALIAGETQYKVWAVFKDVIKHGVGGGGVTEEGTGLRRGGASGFERIFRKPLFGFLAEHADIYAVFNAAMAQRVEPMRLALLDVCEVKEGETVVDIGGGLGSVVVALLEKFPQVRGVLFDTPMVIAQAEEALRGNAVRGRLSLVAGDFLQRVSGRASGDLLGADEKHRPAVPAGDVMILASVLHMVQDGEAVHILKNCRASLSQGGRLYVVESLLCGANEADPAKWHDLNMMMMAGGRERTAEQYVQLLNQAGFAIIEERGGIILTYRE